MEMIKKNFIWCRSNAGGVKSNLKIIKMKQGHPPKKHSEKEKPSFSPDHTGTETDSDHTGTDCDNDNTTKGTESGNKNKFDKPKREVDPDTTGIDIDADKTKKQINK
jgi:hypothetical protein